MDNLNTAPNNFRDAVLTEPDLMPSMGLGTGVIPSSSNILQTPAGNVRALSAPALPQPPAGYSNDNYGLSGMSNMNGYGYGNGYGGGFGSYGGGYGSYGYGGGYGGGGYGAMFGGGAGYGFGGYNRFGSMNPMDPEARFIQLAEASSRPAFQSIESLVSAIGNIAAMLDSTFFALTSSFRAILGVAANFGRLRGVFAQFWHTFAIFRGLTWIYRKLLYWLRLSNLDPSSENFKKAFAEAVNDANAQVQGAPKLPRKGQSPWPVVAFISFIFTAPYLIMRLLGTVTNTAQEEARNPSKWVQPIKTVALYDFQARGPGELTMYAGQEIIIAPREIQNTLGLMNTGWGVATIDGQSTGIIPINYLKSPQQMRQERTVITEGDLLKSHQNASMQIEPANQSLTKASQQSHQNQNQLPEHMNLSASAFPKPPASKSVRFLEPSPELDFEIAPQPLMRTVGGGGAPPTVDEVAFTPQFEG